MDIEILEEFIALAESCSFQETADRLHISQSSLSKHLKKLEAELGAALFDRSTRSVSLNELGMAFLPHARRIAAEKANLKSYRVKVLPEEKEFWEQLSTLFGEENDEDMNLVAKMRLSWKYFFGAKMTRPQIIPRIEREMLYLGEATGLQARLPFIVLD